MVWEESLRIIPMWIHLNVSSCIRMSRVVSAHFASEYKQGMLPEGPKGQSAHCALCVQLSRPEAKSLSVPCQTWTQQDLAWRGITWSLRFPALSRYPRISLLWLSCFLWGPLGVWQSWCNFEGSLVCLDVPSVASYLLFLSCTVCVIALPRGAGALATVSSRERLQHPRAREESDVELESDLWIQKSRCIWYIALCLKKRSRGRKRMSDGMDAMDADLD